MCQTITTPEARANVYHTPAEPGNRDIDTYYFCCETCGNCGRRWTGRTPAVEDAIRHVVDHPLQEGNNA